MFSSIVNSGFILIVDDNPTNLSVLAYALKGAGFSIRIATDGQSAIEQIQDELPELILLDVQMPGIDGFETCKRLKANPTTQDIPIIFMTALADVESKVKGLSLGAVDYITKPFEQEEVLVRVRIHLQLRHLTKTLQQWNENLEQQVVERTSALQKAQVQLVQQEKLATLGQLVAGVAHEINNPMSCIVSNITPASRYLTDIKTAIALYQKYYPQPVPEISQVLEELDIDFCLDDLSKILNSMKLSADRIQNILVSLRRFSRSDSTKKMLVNLHDGIDSSLIILQHRLKGMSNRPGIDVIKEYGELPAIECYPGPLNQVFMNILANAIDALEDRAEPAIRIKTELLDQKWVKVQILDNGSGIAEDLQLKLFEPLFTTKPVGKGTGLGLSISRQIVEEKHGGKIELSSEVGKGTCLSILIPI
ncbi:response regulator [Kamptonema animale CS-326]|jgi:signal transduction histidine kinase|uniref:hybrid sensor histidine kinase/response regulator n=1 Tax=Kamptonema animale TaxID=92934 RepID=UPI00232EB06D|nr:response regulator [Kamptonema animale]MDB9510868.1 response regulator [Kamptonema animale CS-326]